MKPKKYVFLLVVAAFFTGCSKNNGSSQTLATVTNTTSLSVKGVKVGYYNSGEGKARVLANIGDLLSSQQSTFQIPIDTISRVYLYLDANSKTYIVTDPYPIVRGSNNPILITITTPATEIEPSSPLFPQ